MRRITLQQIEELSERERLQLRAYINNHLGSLYKRMNQKSDVERQIESEAKDYVIDG